MTTSNQTDINQALAACLSGHMIVTSPNQNDAIYLFERVKAAHQKTIYIDVLPWYITKGKKK